MAEKARELAVQMARRDWRGEVAEDSTTARTG
jgi:hypothetical protein